MHSLRIENVCVHTYIVYYVAICPILSGSLVLVHGIAANAAAAYLTV